MEEGRYSASTSRAARRPLEFGACAATHGVDHCPDKIVFSDNGHAYWTGHFDNNRTISQGGRAKRHQELECSYKTDAGTGRREFTSDTHHHWLLFYTSLFLVYVLLVAKLYSYIEGWRYLDSSYWVIVTALTIGFGDVKPVTPIGRGLVC